MTQRHTPTVHHLRPTTNSTAQEQRGEEPILRDLELSVRAFNVLNREGVRTLDDFMALTEQRVRTFKNAGTRTWKEIRSVQLHLSRDPFEPGPGSLENELQRTAEMYLDMCDNDKPHMALWFLYDCNRYDARSLKRLCEIVEQRFKESRLVVRDPEDAGRDVSL